MSKLEVYTYTGCIVQLTNGDQHRSTAREYEVHPATGVLVLKDRERSTFAPGSWLCVRMTWKEGAC